MNEPSSFPKFPTPIVVLIFALLLMGLYVLFFSTVDHEDISRYECCTIHKPKSGCPPGWFEFPSMFTEKNGTKVSGCFTPESGKECIDYLLPGESITITIIPPTRRMPDGTTGPKKL